jgi:hypothetical protein
MGRASSQARRVPRGAAGDGASSPQEVRETELSLCQWGGVSRDNGAQLQGGRQDQAPDAASGRGRAGAGGDRTLQEGEGWVGGRRQRGVSEADRQAGRVEKDELKASSPSVGFEASAAQFDKVRGFLAGEGAAALEHFELEEYLRTEGFELLRLLLQDHFDVRELREVHLEEVRGAGGVAHRAVEAHHQRRLATIVGTITTGRLAYRHRGEENLYLADAMVNLPPERHSHGLRELAAIESSRGSFAEAKEAITRATGVVIGQRQVEQLAQSASRHVEAFYHSQPRPAAEDGEVVVISADGKGVVMRPDALRAGTAAAAAKTKPKLKSRLSKGEKANRKRMAEVAAVYTVKPVPRTPVEVMASAGDDGPKEAPEAKDKWLTASVADDAAAVIAKAFAEADRRDPDHTHPWIALVDGNNHQIDRIKAEAKHRKINLTIVVDLVHVLGYLWNAAWCFYPEGDPAAEEWVANKATEILQGKAGLMAAAIKRKATNLGLDPQDRKGADTCAAYLKAKARYLDYPKALAAGFPIATGVIEGACRYLVKDRLDVTGARWGLKGAEAILKLRAVRKNGDWRRYWSFHLAQERQQTHQSRYLNNVLPAAA